MGAPELQAVSFPALEGEPVDVRGGAGTRAARILAEARVEARRIEAAAEAAGREAGHAAGLAEAREQIAPARAALEEALAGVGLAQAELAASLEQRAAELALALAEKVVASALELRPELVLDVVAGAVRRAASRDRLVLQVNPADRAVVEDAAEAIARSLGGVQEIEVRSERRVERGGCIVRTEEGEIDAQATEQLQKARSIVLDAIRTR